MRKPAVVTILTVSAGEKHTLCGTSSGRCREISDSSSSMRTTDTSRRRVLEAAPSTKSASTRRFLVLASVTPSSSSSSRRRTSGSSSSLGSRGRSHSRKGQCKCLRLRLPALVRERQVRHRRGSLRQRSSCCHSHDAESPVGESAVICSGETKL